MNSVFLSPHFPPNFQNFASRLKNAGATVLGLSDVPYDSLSHDLKCNLTEYYKVSDMHDHDQLTRALGYFTHRYGKIHHLDSHNEYWLETEARLRTDFNIPGINMDQIYNVKKKSEMKRIFDKAKLNPARGRVCNTEQEVRDFIKEVGYPVIAKPDNGVGAAATFKLESDQCIDVFLRGKPNTEYILEEFVTGQIVSYDGLVDKNGELIFSSSLRYNKGVMEAVNENSDIYYYCVREIEPFLENAGKAILKAFDVRGRFFHFEFFLKDNAVVPLEVNMRPPGGLTLDMFNFIFDFDCYDAWAQMQVHNVSKPMRERKYFVIYVGRKDHIHYALNHEQAVEKHKDLIVHHERIDSIFAPAIGNYGYMLRHAELKPLIEAAESIQKRA
ncbi:MAG TPA: ATP-grasp domain-containing protein [Candidatus Melainabacteria bacterium]|nr:ATP-grasp domain-containing protein [Candidatus Melainabacteria bacterium]